MKPKEKAKELVDKFIPFAKRPSVEDARFEEYEGELIYNAKGCALICTEEQKENDWHILNLDELNKWIGYWEEVEEEINKL